ncbi:hypothetical protein BDK51DRAFT_26996 [Blyttiomyces helicus]|uniref:Uncharacterized protein n=1 Tax=Blyttiomyces helicus TaxID=388810 RepID=A0A4P9WMF3_9FUNG|nr:hypothetical protein BDK51DRAFT_26996 [Blyttiomyces helicus]|eukprot:RKO94249.1 hypothetical protein BDK51DRAFT_26996 [Blyttiomyces helicus]
MAHGNYLKPFTSLSNREISSCHLSVETLRNGRGAAQMAAFNQIRKRLEHYIQIRFLPAFERRLMAMLEHKKESAVHQTAGPELIRASVELINDVETTGSLPAFLSSASTAQRFLERVREETAVWSGIWSLSRRFQPSRMVFEICSPPHRWGPRIGQAFADDVREVDRAIVGRGSSLLETIVEEYREGVKEKRAKSLVPLVKVEASAADVTILARRVDHRHRRLAIRPHASHARTKQRSRETTASKPSSKSCPRTRCQLKAKAEFALIKEIPVEDELESISQYDIPPGAYQSMQTYRVAQKRSFLDRLSTMTIILPPALNILPPQIDLRFNESPHHAFLALLPGNARVLSTCFFCYSIDFQLIRDMKERWDQSLPGRAVAFFGGVFGFEGGRKASYMKCPLNDRCGGSVSRSVGQTYGEAEEIIIGERMEDPRARIGAARMKGSYAHELDLEESGHRQDSSSEIADSKMAQILKIESTLPSNGKQALGLVNTHEISACPAPEIRVLRASAPVRSSTHPGLAGAWNPEQTSFQLIR